MAHWNNVMGPEPENNEWERLPEEDEWERWREEDEDNLEEPIDDAIKNANKTRKSILNTPLTDAQKGILGAKPPTPFTGLPEDKKTHLETCLMEHFKGRMAEVFEGKTDADFIPWFRNLLKDNGAIVAGGFILRTLLNPTPDDCFPQPWDASDLDIYVPSTNMANFYGQFLPVAKPYTYVRQAPNLYCRSFLRRNGIRTVLKFKRQPTADPSPQITEIDIMEVRNARSPVDVVQNFDLTFCQVWYDGDALYATHPDHILNKIGYLQGDYVKLYLRRNAFLRKRVNKYRKRGFTIALDPEGLSKLVPSDMVSTRDLTKFYKLGASKEEITSFRCGAERSGMLRTRDFYRRWAIRVLRDTLIRECIKRNTASGEDWEAKTNWYGLEFVPLDKQRYPDTCVKKSVRLLRELPQYKCDDLPVNFITTGPEETTQQKVFLDHDGQLLSPLDGYDTDDLVSEDSPVVRKTFGRYYKEIRKIMSPLAIPLTDTDINAILNECFLKLYLTMDIKYYSEAFDKYKGPYMNALKGCLIEFGFQCLSGEKESKEEEESKEEQAPVEAPVNNLLGGKYKKTRKRKQRKVM